MKENLIFIRQIENKPKYYYTKLNNDILYLKPLSYNQEDEVEYNKCNFINELNLLLDSTEYVDVYPTKFRYFNEDESVIIHMDVEHTLNLVKFRKDKEELFITGQFEYQYSCYENLRTRLSNDYLRHIIGEDLNDKRKDYIVYLMDNIQDSLYELSDRNHYIMDASKFLK